MRLKDRSRLRSTKAPGEAAGAEGEAAASPPEAAAQIIHEGGCTEREMVTAEETAIKNIHGSWEEVQILTYTGVWKKLIPALMDSFQGFRI